VAGAVRDEAAKVRAIDVEVVGAGDPVAVRDVVHVHHQAPLRTVLVVPRVVVGREPDAARLEPLQAEHVEHLIVERGFAEQLVVRVGALHAEEQVAVDPMQVAAHDRAQLVVGLQRLPRSEVVVVVVLDAAADEQGDHALPVLVPGRLAEDAGDRRFRRRVLTADAEHRRA